MGNNDNAQEFKDLFIDALAEQGASIVDMVELSKSIDQLTAKEIFRSWAKKGRDIFFVKGIGFINIHIRAESPGFWGITKSIEEDFLFIREQLGISCRYVLLVGRKDRRGANGYILDDLMSSPLVRRPTEQKMQYKINEGTNLDRDKIIMSIEGVASVLVNMVQVAPGSKQ